MKILVLNAGSSSLKYQLIDMTDKSVLAKGLCERIGIEGGKFKHKTQNNELEIQKDMPTHAVAIELVLAYLTNEKYGVIANVAEIKAIGHRVVNGGEVFSESCIMDAQKLALLETLTEFAPLHNPPAVTGIKACVSVLGDKVPQVAVFDTSFHQSMPGVASIYPLPYQYYEKYGIRRFGAHGTSHKYVAKQSGKVLGRDWKELKIVTCHMGNGSSITAVKNGKSVDTSMGFTPLAGIIMGTRCGDIDPAAAMYIMQKENLSAQEMCDIMNKESGFLGLSGISSDMRDIDEAAASGNARAALAKDIFVYQAQKFIGSYAAAMGGLDVIVFTAGIGENNPMLRARIIENLQFIGAEIDADKNAVRGELCDVSAQGARVKTLVIPTNEELAIAEDTMELVK